MSQPLDVHASGASTIFAAGTTLGAALWDYLQGAGLFTPSAFIAATGFLVGWLANYKRIREGTPLFVSDVKLAVSKLLKVFKIRKGNQ